MFTNEQVPIVGLLERYEAALGAMGYSATTRLLFIRRAELMIRRHENCGMQFLNPEIIADYAREIQERHFAGRMKRRYYERAMREIERFVSFSNTGDASALPSPLRGPKVKLTPEFTHIADEFLAGDFHPNTRCDMRWTVYKYFAWLEEEGFRSLENVEAKHLQKYLLFVSERFAPSSVYNMRLYLRKLYAFLFSHGYSSSDVFHQSGTQGCPVASESGHC